MNKFAVLFIICAIAAGSANANWADKEPWCFFPDKYPVTMQILQVQISLAQYSGLWYEIARKPMAFETECECAQAQYTPQGAKVGVLNSCSTKDGHTSSSEGYAISQNSYNSRLDVYFNPNTPGEYWILDIDPNYQWVVVGEPCKKFGWILSRTKTLSQQSLNARIQTLVDRGYDIHNLVYRGNC